MNQPPSLTPMLAQTFDFEGKPADDTSIGILCPECGQLRRLSEAAQYGPDQTVYACPNDGAELAWVKVEHGGSKTSYSFVREHLRMMP